MTRARTFAPALAFPVALPLALAISAGLAGCASSAARPATPPETLRALYRVPTTSAFDVARTALVLVDFQEEFFHGRLAVPDGARAVAHASTLLAWARDAGITVVHVRNVTKPGSALFAPGSPTVAFVPDLEPRDGELVVTKPTGGAFTKTDLEAQLRTRGIDTIVVGGIMTHLAVPMTAQDGALLGLKVVVASDATATRDLPGALDDRPIDHETLSRASLASVADRFADVMPTARIVSLPLQR